ncbi:hypothetical protein AVEN_209550-1 [Araneus ventricosus]|uniref:Uncharacterized protein n=1 Tax=Araneus ventricosus TaxID=182803 RepID=A0A4Y2P8A8_ARAVE|nr:hypothetical protein AVEN_209550-1 [Araneus ventricosus]
MPRRCINTLRGIVKCRANSTTTTIIAVRRVKPFEVGRERSMLREEVAPRPYALSAPPQSRHRNEPKVGCILVRGTPGMNMFTRSTWTQWSSISDTNYFLPMGLTKKD